MRIMTRDKTFYRSIVILAIPVALQSLITFAVSSADNLMLSSLGDIAVSGVYMANQIQTLLQMIASAVGGATLILSAQYWGKQDTGSIRRIISTGLQVSILFSLLLTVVCLLIPSPIIRIFTTDAAVVEAGTLYLKITCLSYIFFCVSQALIYATRSVEVTHIGTIASSLSLLAKLGLNYLLIYGHFGIPSLGLAGAAASTLLARMVETLVMVFYLAKIDKKLNMKFSDLLRIDKEFYQDFLRYGTPLVAGDVVWSFNMMASSAILGRFGASVTTAASVANTMNSLAYITMNGMSAAVGIITGKTVGAGKTELMKEYARTVQVIFLILGVITGGAVFLLNKPFVSLYDGISAEAVQYSVQFINVLAVIVIGNCYQAAGFYGLVKAGGDISFVFKMDTIFVFLLVLPSALLAFWLGLPAWIVFACLKCDQFLKAFVAVVKINKFNWMKNLTRDNVV